MTTLTLWALRIVAPTGLVIELGAMFAGEVALMWAAGLMAIAAAFAGRELSARARAAREEACEQ